MTSPEVPHEFRCRCTAHHLPCHHRASQEDMLCDACRPGGAGGMCSLIAVGPHDQPEAWFHTRISAWKTSFTGATP